MGVDTARRSRGSALVGLALVAVGAACFASKGVFAKYLYADGWSAEAVATLRAVFALPIVAAWALWRGRVRALAGAPRSALLGAAAGGVLCYYLGSLLDFQALTLIDVSVERVLLFSYPSMVVLLYAAIYRSWPRPRVLAALAVTYLGIFLVVGGSVGGVPRASLTGAGLVLVCALTFAVYYLASDRWTPVLGSVNFTLCALTVATACLAGQFLLHHGVASVSWSTRDGWLMAGLVAIATALPMLSMAEGVRRVGAERAAVVSTVGPPTTILLGAGFLGERLNGPQWLGVLFIIAGIGILELARRAPIPVEPGLRRPSSRR
jgi:drug/metabolite transporter (DMT)-like permease